MRAVRPKRAGSIIFFHKFMKIRIEIEGKEPGSVKYQGPDSAVVAIKYLGEIEADEIQIEIRNDDGNRSEGNFSGKNCFESAIKFLRTAVGTFVNPHVESVLDAEKLPDKTLTLKNHLEQFLKYEYRAAWFSSMDVRDRYEKVHGKISLGTVSTYLARMYNDNLLERKGNRNHREYRLLDQPKPMVMESAAIK